MYKLNAWKQIKLSGGKRNQVLHKIQVRAKKNATYTDAILKRPQMEVSHETGSEANFGFGHALMPSYLGMCPPKAAFFFFFRMQPMIDNLPRCDDRKKLGVKPYQMINLRKKNINALIFRLITCVNALTLTPLIYIYIQIYVFFSKSAVIS